MVWFDNCEDSAWSGLLPLVLALTKNSQQLLHITVTHYRTTPGPQSSGRHSLLIPCSQPPSHSPTPTMSVFFSALARIFGVKKKQVNISVVGLDNSGKSSLLHHLKPSTSDKGDVHEVSAFSVATCCTWNLSSTALPDTCCLFLLFQLRNTIHV